MEDNSGQNERLHALERQSGNKTRAAHRISATAIIFIFAFAFPRLSYRCQLLRGRKNPFLDQACADQRSQSRRTEDHRNDNELIDRSI